MLYSAVSQPPSTRCAFIQRGTSSMIVAAQITRVFPKDTSTEPAACGATWGMKEIGRSWSAWRPSWRVIDMDGIQGLVSCVFKSCVSLPSGFRWPCR
jgi:hypothetical protein